MHSARRMVLCALALSACKTGNVTSGEVNLRKEHVTARWVPLQLLLGYR